MTGMIPAVSAMTALTCLAAGMAESQTTSAPSTLPSAPTSRPSRPRADYVKDLIDDYSQGAERVRFLDAAGVDGQLTKAEFTAAKGKRHSLVRPYDVWPAGCSTRTPPIAPDPQGSLRPAGPVVALPGLKRPLTPPPARRPE